MAGAGAFAVRGVADLTGFAPGDELPVPGRPKVVFTPGHTPGHSALLLEDRSTLLCGDALVTLDPYTGATGPRIVAGAATADSAQALGSLRAIADTEADLVLPGHGEPWRTGAAAAAAAAGSAGAS
jgi:glyoxylase-like metal-dependent hydrolase (beta-lactamase superfamily II)